MDLEILPARATDVDALLVLLAAQLEEHEIAIDRAALRAAVAGALEVPARGSFLVARTGGDLVGVAYLSFTWTLEHGGKSAWLEELYVVPERREHGIGTRLLSAACEHARDAGCAAVDLEVESSHARAANLYARTGFTPHRR